MARHRLVDCDRCRKRHSMLRLGQFEADELTGREPDPVDAFERKCIQEQVRDALDELRQHVKHRDFEAFRLRWMEGWSVNEIARHLGMTEGQIWSSHHRTGDKLRPLLAAAHRIENLKCVWPPTSRAGTMPARVFREFS